MSAELLTPQNRSLTVPTYSHSPLWNPTLIATSSTVVLRRPLESTQYCSVDYQAELKANGILISMSGRGNCFDNALVETFFKTLKSELVWRTAFETRADAAAAIGRYIDGFYNPIRRHSALDFTSPAQFEKMAAT